MGAKGKVKTGGNPHKFRNKRALHKRSRQSYQMAKARKEAEREQRSGQHCATERHRHSLMQYFSF